MNTIYKIGSIAGVIALIALGVINYPLVKLGNYQQSCNVTTTTAVVVGADVSTTLLSARSGRAFARIQQVRDNTGVATSSVFTAQGATATLNNGMELSTSTPYLEFGFDTFNPYDGIVTGISNVGSTTVLVTECR